MTWKPRVVPESYNAKYFEDEFAALQKSFVDNIVSVELRKSDTAPLRPRQGTTIYADGVNFNPGNGEGVYVYNSLGQWVPLGVPHPGVAKSWVMFTASGGTVSILSGLNVSSVQRHATGDFSVLFTTALSSSNYAFSANAGDISAGGRASPANVSYPTATSFRFSTFNSTSSAIDFSRNSVIIFGAG